MKALFSFALILALILAATSAPALVPTQIRSVTTLPATCNPGNGIIPMDIVALSSGGITTPYYCQITNTWVAFPGGSSLTGAGTATFIPLWTGPTTLGNSALSNVTGPPAGLNYSLGGGQFWQLDASHLSFNTGLSGSSSVVIANTWAPGANNNAGGIILQGAPATGSACGGNAALEGNGTNGLSNYATITADGGCSNGFGAIGGSAEVAAGSTSASNPGGNVYLKPGTGGFGNGYAAVVGNFPFYLGHGALAMLTTALVNGVYPIQMCTDCKSARDGVLQGSIAVTGGTNGSLVFYDGVNFRVLGGASAGGGGSLPSGVAGQSVVYSSPSSVVGSSAVYTINSGIAGTHWTDKVATVYGAAPCSTIGCTIVISGNDFNGDDGAATSLTIPANVNLQFTGSGTLGFCQINVNTTSKIYNLGNVQLLMDAGGSNCIGINLTVQTSLQSNDTAIFDGLRINCNGQPGSTGMFFGNTARVSTSNNSVSACQGVGIGWEDTQFISSSYDHLWNNFVNAKIYNVTGGGNSNSFWHLTANNPGGSGVNVMVADVQSSVIDSQGDIGFWQPELQNGAVAQMCVFGKTTTGTDVHIYGGAFELGGGNRGTATFTNGSASIGFTNTLAATETVQFSTTGTLPTNFTAGTTYYVIATGLTGSTFEVSATLNGSPISAGSAGTGTQTVYRVSVIDGNTCKTASIYGNLAYLYVQDQSVAEATVTPLYFVENNSNFTSLNNQGYGGAGPVFDADSTSLVLFLGMNWWPNGTLEAGAGTFLGAPQGGAKYASAILPSTLTLGLGTATLPSVNAVGFTNNGLYFGASGNPILSVAGAGTSVWLTNGQWTNVPLIFCSAAFGLCDTAFSRISPQVEALGNGAAGDFSGTLKLTIANAVTGYQVNSAAASGNYLRGNGTNFVSSPIQAGDLPSPLILPGLLDVASFAIADESPTSGATYNVGNLGCYTATNTVGDCPTAASNVLAVGILQTKNGTKAVKAEGGQASVNSNAAFQAAGGDIICADPSNAAVAVDNVATPCPSTSKLVGIAAGDASSVTSHTVDVAIGDPSAASGAGTNAQVCIASNQTGSSPAAKINACVTTLSNGGTIDATGFPCFTGANAQLWDQGVVLGFTGTGGSIGKGHILILNTCTQWNVTISDKQTVPLTIHPQSGVIANLEGANGSQGFNVAASANFPELIAADCDYCWLNISAISRSGTTVTVTTSVSGPTLTAQPVLVYGVTDLAHFANGIKSMSGSGTSYTYTEAGSAVSSSGGAAGFGYTGFHVSVNIIGINANVYSSSATMLYGIHVYAPLQGTIIRGINAGCPPNGVGLEVDGDGTSVGPADIIDDTVDCSSATLSTPLEVTTRGSGGQMGGINIIGGLYAHEGVGKPDIRIADDGGNFQNQGVNLFGTNIEDNSATALGVLLSNVISTNISGLSCGSATGNGISCLSLTNSTYNVTATSITQTGAYTNTINDTSNGHSFQNTTLRVPSWVQTCTAVGSAANPSVAACSLAPTGAFSCSTSASTGTCQVTDGDVTANSNIWVEPTGATSVGTRLGVTCNTTSDTGLTAPRVSAIASGSFTINLGTFSTNPECFMFGVRD